MPAAPARVEREKQAEGLYRFGRFQIFNFAAEQARKKLEARLVDEFHPGEQQSETDHQLKGEHYKIKLELCNGCKKCAEACPCGYIELR